MAKEDEIKIKVLVIPRGKIEKYYKMVYSFQYEMSYFTSSLNKFDGSSFELANNRNLFWKSKNLNRGIM